MSKLIQGPLPFIFHVKQYLVADTNQSIEKSIAATEDPTLADPSLGDLAKINILDQFTPDEYERIYYEAGQEPHWILRQKCFQPLKDTWRDLTNVFTLNPKPYRAWRHAAWDLMSPIFGLIEGFNAWADLVGAVSTFVVGVVAWVGSFFPNRFPKAQKIYKIAFPLAAFWLAESISYAVSAFVKLVWLPSLARCVIRSSVTSNRFSTNNVGIPKIESTGSKKTLAEKGLRILDSSIPAAQKKTQTDHLMKLLHLDYNQRLAKALASHASAVAKEAAADVKIAIPKIPSTADKASSEELIDITSYISRVVSQANESSATTMPSPNQLAYNGKPVTVIVEAYQQAKKTYEADQTNADSEEKYKQAVEEMITLRQATRKAYQQGLKLYDGVGVVLTGQQNGALAQHKRQLQATANHFYYMVLSLIYYPAKLFVEDPNRGDFIMRGCIADKRAQYHAERQKLTAIYPREEMQLYYGKEKTSGLLLNMDLETRVEYFESCDPAHGPLPEAKEDGYDTNRKRAYFSLFANVPTFSQQQANGDYPEATTGHEGDDEEFVLAPAPVPPRRPGGGGF